MSQDPKLISPASPLKIKRIMFSNGERYPLLIEKTSGEPHWHATLFITSQARNASKASNTMLAMLAAVQTLLS